MIIPKHIAIILDGNGRWASLRGLPRAAGHKAGCETLEKIIEECCRLDIKYLTVYAFSTENWKRSSEEVNALMDLFRFYAKRIVDKANNNNVKVKMIGDPSRFAEDIRQHIINMQNMTENNTGMEFIFAVNYGGRDEIVRAVKSIISEGISPDIIDESVISRHLDTRDIPDPDLLIRTSGELRISNFLNWQISYSEIYVTDVLWPDFNKEELIKAIESYNLRNRRYGGR